MFILNVRTTLDSAWERAVDQLVSIGLAFLYILVIILIAKTVVKLVRRFVWKRIGANRIDVHTATLINNGISVCVYFIAATLLLALGGASWSTLLTAISISTLAVVLGLQDLLKSLLGGAFVMFDQPYSIGDRIEVEGKTGEVVEVRLRTTVLRTPEGRRMTLPNSIVLSSPIENLDREVTSSTVVLVDGVVGDADEVSNQIQQALSIDPAVDSTVSVTSQTPRSLRIALSKWSRALRESQPVETAQVTPLTIRVILADESDQRSAEENVVERITQLYPTAKCSVRPASRSQ